MSEIIVRMPPSPTGSLHLGTARSALFNWLFAKKNSGKIIFRWEDTDKERSKAVFEQEIFDGLAWLGMDFEKETDQIYRQSENQNVQKKHLQKLWEEEKVFPCFSTTKEIDTLRQKARDEKTNFVFWSPYRDLGRKELTEKMDKIPFVWRIKTPKNQWINFKDSIRKKVSVNTDTIGDFAIARSDGSVLYMFANTVDDATQGITHVIRGEDHISNTPKQILLYEALEYRVPIFAHIPLVFDKNKKKLSKRNIEPGIAVLITDFQKLGFIPEGVINGLVFLGWNPKSTKEIFSITDLEKNFDLANVNSAPSQYNFDKMIWFNTQWMRKIKIEKLQKYYQNFSQKKIEIKYLELAREKARTLKEISEEIEYLITDPGINPKILLNKKFGIDFISAKKNLLVIKDMIEKIPEKNFNRTFIQEQSIKCILELGIKNGEFLWPFRTALSNRTGSAGPFEISEVIGKKETLRRVKRAIQEIL